MASLRDIRKRIRSVTSTQKITRAMKMVAAARLRRAQERVTQSTPYAEKIEDLLGDLASSAPPNAHPLLTERPVEKRALVVLSADRGLCGAFNASMLRAAEAELRKELPTELITVGKKGTTYFERRDHTLHEKLPEFWSTFAYETATKLSENLASLFIEKRFDRIDVLYSRFKSVISQKPTLLTLAPISRPPQQESGTTDQIYEPGRDEILHELLPRALDVRFFVACLHTQASELGARMTAMDSATRNSEEMIDKLTLDMNRARQASITTELMEIISGAEALK